MDIPSSIGLYDASPIDRISSIYGHHADYGHPNLFGLRFLVRCDGNTFAGLAEWSEMASLHD